MSIYGKHIGKKLKDHLEELSNDEDRRTLQSEVDLARANALQALKLWEIAHYSDVEVDAKTKLRATVLLRESLIDVRDMVTASEKLESLKGAMFPVQYLDGIIAQILRAMAEELGPANDEVYKRIAKRIESIKLTDQQGAAVINIV